MSETERYIRSLMMQQGIISPERFRTEFNEFVSKEENINYVNSIRLLQENMTKSWQITARRAEINSLQVVLPNGFAGKPYKAKFDLDQYGLTDITSYKIAGFEHEGLEYDAETGIVSGIPLNSGDIELTLFYNFEGEPLDAEPNCKKIKLIINPDPKSLWKDIPSDEGAIFAKADNVHELTGFLGKKLIVSSKRGRSHANKGTFRDDDYRYAELESGWGIIAVSDGAGSAKYSREGSAIACSSVTAYFKNHFTVNDAALTDAALILYAEGNTTEEKIYDIMYPHVLTAARKALSDIGDAAKKTGSDISDFHATLTFVLVKEHTHGNAFISFGVGDCPAVVIDKGLKWSKPLNKLDVGEYGGGTRFVTMPDILNTKDAENRVNFLLTQGAAYLVLMSDGIYDPKFEVEANLANPEKWKYFFDDLQGSNDEGIKVDINSSNADASEKLSRWMDFWSPGNHDDRTLAILL